MAKQILMQVKIKPTSKAYNSNSVVHKVIDFCFLCFIQHLLNNQASHAANESKPITFKRKFLSWNVEKV